jgi:tetratricopeptide (TPR) repeat protein
MTASPAKIKAFLATIKGRLLDGGDADLESTIRLHEVYLGLLQMELLLRGVLVQEDSKVANQVKSCVGKTLLSEQLSSSAQAIPGPLLAGANVVAGRVAEAYYRRLLSGNQREEESVYGPSFSKEDADAGIQRAKDIQDIRWLVLLRNLPFQSPEPGNKIDAEAPPASTALEALQVALGYYTTAALIQSDTPPMWKKVWDLWTLLNVSTTTVSSSPILNAPPPPFEAQVAIESLARIAFSKGNTKRGSELQLTLIQSYLNRNRTILSKASFSTDQPVPSKPSAATKTDTASVAECFGDSLIASRQLSLPPTAAMALSMAHKAKATLDACRSYFEKVAKSESNEQKAEGNVDNGSTPVLPASVFMDHPDVLLFQVLQVHVAMAVEDAEIQQQAEDDYKMDQNRSVAKANPTEYLEKARESWIIGRKPTTATADGDAFLQASQTLRDSLLVIWEATSLTTIPNEGAESDSSRRDFDAHKYLAFYWVHQAILRLQSRAEILSGKTGNYSIDGWYAVLQYILPILVEVNRQIHSGTPAELNETYTEEDIHSARNIDAQTWLDQELYPGGDSLGFKKSMLASVVAALPKAIWMVISDQGKIGKAALHPLDDELKLGIAILSCLIHQQQHVFQSEKQSEQASSTVGSEKRSDGVNNLLQWEQARQAALCMVCQGSDNEIYHVTRDAIRRSKGKEAGGYFSFLQCLVAWSGWYQRPWPYCSNLSDVRALLSAVKVDLGRPLTSIEEILLDLASADAELLNGGRIETAANQYVSVLERIRESNGLIPAVSTALLNAHCLNGMARIQQLDEGLSSTVSDKDFAIKDFAMKNLEDLQELEIPSKTPPLCIWHRTAIFSAAKVFKLSAARQLVADRLIQRGHWEDARSFLEAAVEDSPTDVDAALALGAFLLRMALYSREERNSSAEKNAQIHLLKAAKLDPSKANPFALIGVWFEDQGDDKRARGCYTKSLGLDPCNPIAGRGLLRLIPREDIRDVLGAAINVNSPLNGWAWHSVGLNKSFVEGEDDLAAIAILKGLRARDIASPESENLSIFYTLPQIRPSASEKAIALGDVGTCYRRLGRFTASIRAFHASIDDAGELVPSNVLISCAQVELELGLFDDAVQKFELVLARKEPNSHPIASYGHATALLTMAERDLGDGKAGSAYRNTLLAIESCLKSDNKFGCTWKLLGDLYTFGASFPPSVYSESGGLTGNDVDNCIERQILFVAEGEEAYRSSLKAQTQGAKPADEDDLELKCLLQCDIATNILLRAQILDPVGVGSNDPIGNDLYERAATAFRAAIESNPLHAASWCGFGCAVINKDPLLAQHAFCRSIQLEKMFADAYANVGFLYTSMYKFSSSRSAMEALTQVADTPMMWMNCAFLLEREAEMILRKGNANTGPEELIVRSADAYRAALQVMKHPDAQFGLSLASRVTNAKSATQKNDSNPFWKTFHRIEGSSLMQEYMGASFRTRGVANVLNGVMSIEKAVEASPEAKWSEESYREGKEMLNSALGELDENTDCLNVPLLRNIAGPTNIDVDIIRPATLDEQSNQGSIQRRILCYPDRADLWMSLAKDFVQNDSLEAAMEAAVRASAMLTGDLSHPQQNNGGCTSIVDAQQISEALSLEGWLRILSQTEPSGMGDKSASFCFQQALFMNPENILARQALVQETG